MQTGTSLSSLLRRVRPLHALQKSFPWDLSHESLYPIQLHRPRCNLHTSRILQIAQPRYRPVTTPSPYRSLHVSTSASPKTSESDTSDGPHKPPCYELTFTCKPCKHRSSHTISKHGYHHGTVLITCPECSNRHVISDHLRIFADQAFTIEDLMRQKGELVKRGTLEGDGDIEFWQDGNSAERMNQRPSP